MTLKGFGQFASLLPTGVQCSNKSLSLFSRWNMWLLKESWRRGMPHVSIDCGEDEITRLPGGKTDQKGSGVDMEQRRQREHDRNGDLFSLGTSIWYSAAPTQSLPTSTHHKPTHLALLKEPYECSSSKTILQHHFRRKHIGSISFSYTAYHTYNLWSESGIILTSERKTAKGEGGC